VKEKSNIADAILCLLSLQEQESLSTSVSGEFKFSLRY